MADPALAVTINAAKTGPNSRIMLKATAEPSNPSDPNLRNV
jgi:hypothetical protein